MTFPPLSEQCCGNCRYYLATRLHSGLCRRNPPQIGSRGEQWPSVIARDWCGEWVGEEAQP